MLWEAEIYSRTSSKGRHPDVEPLIEETIDISEWLKFEFYDLLWFWNNQSDYTKQMLGRWLGVSHMLVIDLCYWIITDKGNVLSRTIVQHLNSEEPRDPDVQNWVRDQHGCLEDVIVSKEFGTILDGYDYFINDDEEGITKGEPNEEGYQVPSDLPEIYEIIDNSDKERVDNSYDQYIGAEVVLPDQKGEN